VTAPLDALIPDSAELLTPEQRSRDGRELRRDIEAQARDFLRAGVARGDALAIALPDGPEMLTASLAAASMATCAPLNPAFCEAEFELYLSSLGVRALIAEPGSPAIAAAQRLGIPLFQPGRPLPGTPAARAYPEAAVLLHTSATTGNSKLVPLSAAHISAMLDSTCGALQLSPDDRFLSMMPLFHLHGLLSCLAQWRAGGSVALTAGFEAREFLSWMEEYRPTWYSAGPTLHRAILSLTDDSFRPGRLRFVRSMGAPLHRELLEQLEARLGVPVIEGYGLTETGLVASNPLRQRKPGSVGRSVGPEIAIIEGEVVIRGPSVFAGYANDPEANREAFRQGWFRSGDLGHIDSEGFLYITGRTKEMINRGGEKVLPLEVDAALGAHPAVEEAVAFSIPHPTLGEDVAAAVVVRAGHSVRESELRQFVSGRLAPFKIPRRIVFPETIPKGPTGKPMRSQLTEQYASEVAASVTPADPLEQRLAAIWAEILKLREVGTADNFFSLGGDSLLALQMLQRVEQECGALVSALSEPATIEHLAVILRNQRPEAPAPAQLFCVPAADENPYSFRLLAQHLGPDTSVWVLRNPEPLAERGDYTVEHVAGLLLSGLRAHRHHGPYLLAGHCFGGIVAFEMARRLLEQGEEVRLLALIDTPRPGYPGFRRDWRLYLRALLRLDWIRRSDHPLSEALVGVRGLWRRIFARLPRPVAPVLPGDVDHANRIAASRYVPGPYAGRIVQIVAADQWMTGLLLDSRLGWGELAAGGFDVQYIAGRHDSLLAEPSVRDLGERLATLLKPQPEA
jgi:acyl-CoA synthetase (AMP-forming)/AMP-acid ligase II/thioesterase domain-containing protein/acyl carrier protein